MVMPRRAIVFAPHPDDESIATGGLLMRLAAAGAAIRVAFLTDGDNDERNAAVRRFEARTALSILGVSPDSAFFLGFPDQRLTQILQRRQFEMLSAVQSFVSDFQPDLIVGPSMDDAHPDHSAAAVLLQAIDVSRLTYIVHGPQREECQMRVWLTPRERERKRRAILAHESQLKRIRLECADGDEHYGNHRSG